jgi:hypothetical protein
MLGMREFFVIWWDFGFEMEKMLNCLRAIHHGAPNPIQK